MTATRAPRRPIIVVAALTGMLCSAAAEAHLMSTGMGPFYDGLMHFLTSPEDLLPVLALSLLTGLRGTAHVRRAMFALPAVWLLGCLLGLSASPATGSALVASFWLLVLGGLVAADIKLSLNTTTTLAGLVGLYHGYLNGTGMGISVTALIAVLGLLSAVFFLLTLCAALVVRSQAPWVRIAARVAGSWIAASGLLMLGWVLRGS